MKTAVFLMTVLAFVSCSNDLALDDETSSSTPNLKISVLQSGQIYLDGVEVTITQVENQLLQLKSKGGSVWYHREAGQQEPPPEAIEVIRLITDNRIPVSMSSKSDFSDYIDENGQSHPRQ